MGMIVDDIDEPMILFSPAYAYNRLAFLGVVRGTLFVADDGTRTEQPPSSSVFLSLCDSVYLLLMAFFFYLVLPSVLQYHYLNS